jgi:hypothetical protein
MSPMISSKNVLSSCLRASDRSTWREGMSSSENKSYPLQQMNLDATPRVGSHTVSSALDSSTSNASQICSRLVAQCSVAATQSSTEFPVVRWSAFSSSVNAINWNKILSVVHDVNQAFIRNNGGPHSSTGSIALVNLSKLIQSSPPSVLWM